MAKKQAVVFSVSAFAAGTDMVNGAVEVQEGMVEVLHKKPRSPKMLRTLIPMGKVVSMQVGDEGYVIFDSGSIEVDSIDGAVSESDIEGFILVTNEDGEEFYVRASAATVEAEEDIETKPAAKAPSKKPAGKKAPKDEEEEPEEKPAKTGKKAPAKKPAKDEEEWDD